jgi:hypothetical protein
LELRRVPPEHPPMPSAQREKTMAASAARMVP